MNWKEEVFQNFKLYAVTDLRDSSPEILQKIDAAYQGGADIIQLRSKNLSDKELYDLGCKIRPIADSNRKLFFVNDRADLALAVKADGVHLGQDDLPVAAARQLFRKAERKLWIGKSTHSIVQGRAAIAEQPDYLGVGPVYGTPTKPGYAPVGLEYVRQASREFKLPFVAIGGIDAQNLSEVLSAGAQRVAMVRAIFSAADIYENTKKLKEEIESRQYAS